MRGRRLLAAGLALAIAITIGSIVLDNVGRTDAGLEAGAPPSPAQSAAQTLVPAPTPTPSGAAGAAVDPPGTPASAPALPEPSVPATAAGTPAPGKTLDPERPLEMDPGAAPAQTGLPASQERTAQLSGPLPASGSEQGKLVAGFPADVVPVPEDTKILSSSVAAEGNILQVGLEGNGGLSQDGVLEVYKADFEKKGWLYTEAPAAQGSRAIRGGFGNDSLTVTVTETGTGRTGFTVFGILHSAG